MKCDLYIKNPKLCGAFSDCSKCKNGVIEPQTNEEWLRNCSTDEMAETIAERIINTHTMFEYILHQDNRREEDLVREVREWLKEKYNDN